MLIDCMQAVMFQHTAARRRLAKLLQHTHHGTKFQHTAARRRLEILLTLAGNFCRVSTHSRPKAAGPCLNKSQIFV